MTKKLLYIAMYRALDCLFDETQREDLGSYLSEANPYLFTDRKSADPAVFEGFSNYFDSFYGNDNITVEDGYKFVKSIFVLNIYRITGNLHRLLTILVWKSGRIYAI